MTARATTTRCVLPLLLAAILALAPTSCKKEVRIGKPVTDKDNCPVNPPLLQEFMKEGFISGDTYRIVVVSPKDGVCDSPKEIENIARKRALASLQKYLMEKRNAAGHNINAEILNLINHSGTLVDTRAKCETREVYHFDIRRNNIRQYIDGLPDRR